MPRSTNKKVAQLSCPPCDSKQPCPHTCQPCAIDIPDDSESYADIVNAYIRDRRSSTASERACWTRHSDGKKAVWEAVMSRLPCGRRHPHQYRIRQIALQEAAMTLDAIEFPTSGSFHDLYIVVHTVVRDISGIGPVTTYDVARRIGLILGLEPEYVYLHSEPKKTARAMGIRGNWVPQNQFCGEFHRLTAAEIEDCLCVYRDPLRRIATRGHCTGQYSRPTLSG